MDLSRRELLKLAGWLGVAPLAGSLAACGDDVVTAGDPLPDYEYDGEPGPATLFQHGVASGDPLPDAVILWTRVTPDSDGAIDVFWEVARDSAFERRLGAGWTGTDADRDYTVKLDAVGLEPGTTVYYRFFALGRQSAVGRTRTAPVGEVDRLRLAVMSCSNYSRGYFHAYRAVAERADLDAVLHLGDYIYESGGSLRPGERAHDPLGECLTLEDYRRRYAQYHTDPDLQAAHQQHPFIAVWDDHETANNSWRDGASGHDASTEGDWRERKAAALQAYFEWIPIRESADGHIYRSFAFGDLVQLVMLDTRLWGRDEQASDPFDRDTIRDPERTLLGDDQAAWLEAQLEAGTALWRLIGQQVMMGHLKGIGAPNDAGGGDPLNTDQWDGYAQSRDRFFELVTSRGLDNVVVLTGDIHSSWAIDLTPDPNNPEAYDPASGRGAIAVEFVAPGITSGIEFPSQDFIRDLVRQQNPHIQWLDLARRGYIVLDADRDRVQAAWFLFDAIDMPEAVESVGAVWAVRDGESHVVEESQPSAPPADFPDPAPIV